ncbi:WD repeat-containing protein wrap73 [Actinomortierella ambigua]|nr:WD repeat-containing protein wrap73 [Actinomortierella ambigua]
MDFTAPYPHNQYLTVHAPNAKYIASFHQTRESTGRLHPSSRTWDPRQDDAGQGMVMIRFTATMKVMRAISVTFNREGMRGIHELAWSPNALMLLAVCQQTGVILVWSLDDEDFKARIDPLGMANPVPGGPGGGGGSGAVGHGKSRHGRSPSSPSAPSGSLSAPASPGRASPQQQQAPKDGMMPRGTRFGPDSRTVIVWEEYLARLVLWDLDWPHQARVIHGVKPMASTAALVGMTKGNTTRAPAAAETRRGSNEEGQGEYDSQQQQQEQDPNRQQLATPSRRLPAPPLTLQAGTTSMATFAHALHRDGRYLGIIERNSFDCKDSLTICRVPHASDPAVGPTTTSAHDHPGNMWHKVRTFLIPELVDVEGVVWSPDGRYLVMWEKPSLGYKVALYTMDGCCQGTFRLATEDRAVGLDVGRKTSAMVAAASAIGAPAGFYEDIYEMPLPPQQRTKLLMGIKTVCWHPSSKLLALGGYDNKIRLLHHLTWNCVADMQHNSTVNYGDDTTLWRESTSNAMDGDGDPGVEYVVVEQPAPLPYTRPDPLKPNPKLGVQWCEFNADGSLLASRSENMPTVIWIWSLQSLKPYAIIQQLSPIRSCRWDPLNTKRLVFCCGTRRVYIWRADQTLRGHTVDVIEVPSENFSVMALRWSPDGRGMLLLDKDEFCLSFPVDPDDTSQYTFVLE